MTKKGLLAEKALRREAIRNALSTDAALDAAVALVDAAQAHNNHPDPINDDEGREAVEAAADAFIEALGYGEDEE